MAQTQANHLFQFVCHDVHCSLTTLLKVFFPSSPSSYFHFYVGSMYQQANFICCVMLMVADLSGVGFRICDGAGWRRHRPLYKYCCVPVSYGLGPKA